MVSQPAGQPTPFQYECNYLMQFFETIGLMYVMLDMLCMVLSFFLSEVCFCASSVQTWHLTWRTSDIFVRVLLNYFILQINSYFRKVVGNCTRQSWKVLWVVLSLLFFKEVWKNVTKADGRMFASAKGKEQNYVRQLQRQGQCIDHIPFYLSGLSRAHFFRQPFSE